ncbi:MAG: YabP/YqfC family sporulation protein [Clostridia bacterium]|nr:YabP/YqfC family sporulation protein [Clostridia bacterium]
MRLFDLISEKLGIDETLSSSIRYTVTEEKSAYFQNVDKLLEFSPVRIVLVGKKTKLTVHGEGLSIEGYYGKDLVLKGKIYGVERSE